MNVGYMRNNLKPTELAKLIAMYGHSYGINVIYLRPKDVNLKTNMVNGKTLVNGQWIPIKTKLPKFVDISQFCFKKKNRDIIKHLRKHTTMSDDGLNRRNKLKFIQEMNKDETVNHLIIPTRKVLKEADVIEFLDQYNSIILKPISGQFGVGIFFIRKNKDNEYMIKYDDIKKIITERDLELFIESDILENKYIVQKYIESKTKEGYPFDCRINMEKDINGEWRVAKRFIRIGIGQQVVSNISQGGAVSNFNDFLKSNYTKDIRVKIRKDMKEISNIVPQKVEALRKQQLMTLGIDVGLDASGATYLFEVNGAPGTSQLKADAADLRAQYYSYILKNIK
ncbi:MAG TPA: YheC/YheD family protein [Pseudogracilibacillus sp.]|nr:YheC/YheD family protein [Pseudogracilibacillus sp.]